MPAYPVCEVDPVHYYGVLDLMCSDLIAAEWAYAMVFLDLAPSRG